MASRALSSKCVRFTSISQFGMQLWFIREASRYTSLPASSGSLLWSLSRKSPKQLESIRDAQSTISSLGGAVKPGQAPSARANALARKRSGLTNSFFCGPLRSAACVWRSRKSACVKVTGARSASASPPSAPASRSSSSPRGPAAPSVPSVPSPSASGVGSQSRSPTCSSRYLRAYTSTSSRSTDSISVSNRPLANGPSTGQVRRCGTHERLRPDCRR